MSDVTHLKRMSRDSFARPCGERGTAMLELTLMLPLVVLIAMGGLGLANGLRHVQAATSFSKAAARITQRTCLERVDKDICLAEIASLVNLQIAGEDYPQTEVRISFYELHPATTPGAPPNYLAYSTTLGNNDSFSTVVISGNVERPYFKMTNKKGTISIGQTEAAANRPRNLLIIAEVYVPLEDVFINLLRFFNFAPQGFYDSTII